MRKLLITVLGAATLLAGCSTATTPAPAGSASASPASAASSGIGADGCITGFDANKDYYPAKVTPTDAKNFTVEYHKSYKVVTVDKPTKDAPAMKLVLVRCGAPKPELTGDLAGAKVIQTPVKRVALSALTQVASMDLLDATDAIVGLSDVDAVSSEKVRALIDAKKISSIAGEKTDLDAEKLATTKPDLVLQPGLPSDAWKKIDSLNLNVAPDGAWLEPTPLARAEWVKYLGLFLDREEAANKRFEQIKNDYNATKQKVAAAASKPKVLVGTQFKGEWTVPQADSYVTAFVKDAGGDYVFANLPGTGTKKVDAEQVYTTGQGADIWLNGNWMSRQRWTTKADALAEDPRYASLPAFAKGAVWNPTKKLSPKGGNDYWESGVVRPDLVLADLAAVMHPDLAKDHQFVYYRQLAD